MFALLMQESEYSCVISMIITQYDSCSEYFPHIISVLNFLIGDSTSLNHKNTLYDDIDFVTIK